MRVVYKQSLVERIAESHALAKRKGREIERVELTKEEMGRLIDETMPHERTVDLTTGIASLTTDDGTTVSVWEAKS